MDNVSGLQVPISPVFDPLATSNKVKTKDTSTIKKVAIVAGIVFASLVIGTGTAILLGASIVVVGPTAAGIGVIAAIVLIANAILASRSNKKTSVSNPLTNHKYFPFLSLTHQKTKPDPVQDFISQQLMAQQESKLEKIAKVMEKSIEETPSSQLSDNQLDQILEVIDETRIALAHQDEYQVLYQNLKKALGEEKAEQAFHVKGLIDNLPLPLSSAVMEHAIEKAQNYFHNQEVYHALREQLDCPELLDQVFEQLDLQEYLTGQRRLSEQTRQAILDCVKSEQIKQNFSSLLDEVKAHAHKDPLLDQQVIEKKFHIDEVLQPLSPEQQNERREELQKIINQAYITRELKQKAKWVRGETDERKLLSYLKFKVDDQSDYQDKDFVYNLLQEIVTTQLQTELKTVSLSAFKEAFKKSAFNARLKAAGLTTPSQIEKFQTLYSLFTTYKQELTEGIDLTLPVAFPLEKNPLAAHSIRAEFEEIKDAYTYQALGAFFGKKQIKEQLQNEKVSTENLRESIEKNKKLLKPDVVHAKCIDLLDPDKSLLARKINFYQKWGSHLQAEMIQGFGNASEALGEGICWAFCQRIRFMGQKHPDITPEQLAEEIKITPQDRYHQGAYGMKFYFASRNKTTKSKIPDFIKREGFEEKQVFQSIYDAHEDTLKHWFNKSQDQLTQSSGWLHMSLVMEDEERTVGHAILMRFDPAQNRYWIIDPNVGFLRFEDNYSPEEAGKECLNCAKDLIETLYPLTYQVSGNQIVSIKEAI